MAEVEVPRAQTTGPSGDNVRRSLVHMVGAIRSEERSQHQPPPQVHLFQYM